MLSDPRTWTTLAYFLLMLPIGIAYFVIATVGLSLGVGFIIGPVLGVFHYFGAFPSWGGDDFSIGPAWLDNPMGFVLLVAAGVLILTTLMHLARGVGRIHVRFAKSLLVTPG